MYKVVRQNVVGEDCVGRGCDTTIIDFVLIKVDKPDTLCYIITPCLF